MKFGLKEWRKKIFVHIPLNFSGALLFYAWRSHLRASDVEVTSMAEGISTAFACSEIISDVHTTWIKSLEVKSLQPPLCCQSMSSPVDSIISASRHLLLAWPMVKLVSPLLNLNSGFLQIVPSTDFCCRTTWLEVEENGHIFLLKNRLSLVLGNHKIRKHSTEWSKLQIFFESMLSLLFFHCFCCFSSDPSRAGLISTRTLEKWPVLSSTAIHWFPPSLMGFWGSNTPLLGDSP